MMLKLRVLQTESATILGLEWLDTWLTGSEVIKG